MKKATGEPESPTKKSLIKPPHHGSGNPLLDGHGTHNGNGGPCGSRTPSPHGRGNRIDNVRPHGIHTPAPHAHGTHSGNRDPDGTGTSPADGHGNRSCTPHVLEPYDNLLKNFYST